MATKKKHFSSIANHVLNRCAETLDTNIDTLVQEFEVGWKPETGNYSRKLIEFCSSKALTKICCYIDEKIADGSFGRFSFDMMLAWETPSAEDERPCSRLEAVAKEKEDRKSPLRVEGGDQDDIPLFYSDLMPLLVNNESSVGEDSFVWLGSLVPLVVDVVNGRFTFDTLTATTANRLHHPAYDRFLREIDKCIKYLQKQVTPTGVELAHDEFILHMEGTARTQRVVRHIGGTSWPGRLMLTNYALYFEASGVISYDDALKIDLAKEVDHNVKRASTGPWGAPIFDKALIYESSQLSDSLVLEFPEMTSSTRREHWFSLIKEIILLHQFLLKFNKLSPLQAWEMQARTILAIVRLHAAREMLRIAPPAPTSFLIFSLFEDLPKGDYVLEELANTLKQVTSINSRSASSILRTLTKSRHYFSNLDVEEEVEETSIDHTEDIAASEATNIAASEATNISSSEAENIPENNPSEVTDISTLESTINQVREETKEANVARATVEGIKEEGLGESFVVMMELLNPLKSVVPWFQEVLAWERPLNSVLVMFIALVIAYKEWIGKAIAAFLIWGVVKMHQARRQRLSNRIDEIVVYTRSEQTTVESIVSAQHGLKTVHAVVQEANIVILKIWSILISKAPKHAEQVMMGMAGSSILLAIIPFKYIIMGSVIYVFVMNSPVGKVMENDKGDRRLKEWWNTIPAVPVRTVDKTP